MRTVTAAAGGAQRLAIRGGEEGERLGVVLDLATDRDEDRLVVADEADDVVAGDVGRGDDGDLRPVERGVEVDGDEAGVGVGRADRRAEPGAGEDEVVGVLRFARELRRALAAERGSAAGTARARSRRGGRRGRPGRSGGARQGWWSGWAVSGSSCGSGRPSSVADDITATDRTAGAGARDLCRGGLVQM